MRDRVLELLDRLIDVKMGSAWADWNNICLELVGMGVDITPWLLEHTAMDRPEAVCAVIALRRIWLNIDINIPEWDVRGGWDTIRKRFLRWGRENRYLVDWICPHCSTGYDVHIHRGCCCREEADGIKVNMRSKQ